MRAAACPVRLKSSHGAHSGLACCAYGDPKPVLHDTRDFAFVLGRWFAVAHQHLYIVEQPHGIP